MWVNYRTGRLGNYEAKLKVYEVRSEFGINEGRISKLYIKRKADGAVMASYDRGWDVEPAEEIKDLYEEILKAFN
jgi:bifunctional DNA-binding transcriptional regulator/antitoxin component of YhaV-PrlF toxin-antitoxin module